MRGAPQRVFSANPANELAGFGWHARATATARTGFPRPQEAESLSMPADDGLWLDDDQGGSPIVPSFA
jgi:hypothetical protein